LGPCEAGRPRMLGTEHGFAEQRVISAERRQPCAFARLWTAGKRLLRAVVQARNAEAAQLQGCRHNDLVPVVYGG
jgi:hypothetical protein